MPRVLRLALSGAAVLLVVLALVEGVLRLSGTDLYPRTSVLAYQEVFPPILQPAHQPAGEVVLRTADPRLPYQTVPVVKGHATLRVVSYGASTTAGLGHSPNVTFIRQLEDLLVEGYPERRIEVLNLGIIATASKQVRVVFEDTLASAAPDLAIVWCGSNEFLSVHAEKLADLDAHWHENALRTVKRTFLFRAVLRAVRGAPSIAGLPGRGETIADEERLTQARIIRRIDVTEAEHDATIAAYQRELEAIVAAARAAGVPLLLCGEAVNDEWTGRFGLPARWWAALPGAPENPEAALSVLDAELARADVGPLERWELLTRRATAKDLAGDVAGANEDWRRSCNLDPHQRRSTDAHLAAVRAAASGRGVAYFDAVGWLRADDPRGRVGFRHFYDYTHFNPRGAALVAAGMYAALQALEGFPRSTSELVRDAQGLPLVLAERLARIETAEVDFFDAREFVGFCFDRANLTSTDLWKYDRAIAGLADRLAADPRDWRALALRGNASSYLTSAGAAEAARRDWEAALALCDEPGAALDLRSNLARLERLRPGGR